MNAYRHSCQDETATVVDGRWHCHCPGSPFEKLDTTMTPEEAIRDALQKNPDCKYADWTNGLDFAFRPTIVVQLWRNEECWAAGDPPKREVQGYRR